MGYEGFHDLTTCTQVSGWARDLSAPDAAVAVEILADGELLATVTADEFRPDLKAAGVGDGRHAFRFALGTLLHDGEPHSIQVRVAGGGFELRGTPQPCYCPHILGEPLPAHVRQESRRRAEQGRPATSAAVREPRSRAVPAAIRVHLVCYEDLDAWILGKYARRLAAGLEALGSSVSIGSEPDPAAEINHHIVHWGYVDRKRTIETVMITHVDDGRELEKVRRQLVDAGVEMGICMSAETVHRLALCGLPRHRLCHVHPGHDAVMRPRKLVVGVTTRVYDDGCKREQLLADLAPLLDRDQFRFVIMGAGWAGIVARMRRAGVEVEYFDDFERDTYVELVPRLDYYLYTGLDEGSLGFVDAVAAAVPTIVTRQGFHLDVAGGITHGFRDLDELARIFAAIAEERARRASAVADWTWTEVARKHGLVWNSLLARSRGLGLPPELEAELGDLGVAPAPPLQG